MFVFSVISTCKYNKVKLKFLTGVNISNLSSVSRTYGNFLDADVGVGPHSVLIMVSDAPSTLEQEPDQTSVHPESDWFRQRLVLKPTD